MIKNILIIIIFIALGTAFTIFFLTRNSGLPILQNSESVSKIFSYNDPPKDSLKGSISSLSGSVSYQTRANDYASPITSTRDIVQGDELSTLGDGKASITFPDIGTINLLPKTNVSIVQTLSQNFVVAQASGNATYERAGNIPFTVRSLDLLINLDPKTNIDVSVDEANSTVSFTINSGMVTFAYTDTDNKSEIINAKPGKEIIFDNNTKDFSVKLL